MTIAFDPIMQAHNREVDLLAAQVRSYYQQKHPYRIYHGSRNSTRGPSNKFNAVINTSNLKNIIKINPSTKTAIVEANVPMDALLEASLKFSLVPLVVTEFPGITVGGAFSGTAGESSSFKHGFFDRTVDRIEMVLADGRIVECSRLVNADLFAGAAGALGTLGVVTLLHVRLQPAATWVEVTYHPVRCVKDAVALLRELAEEEEEEDEDAEKVDFLDGIMFSPTHGAVMIGRLVDHSNSLNTRVQRFSRPSDPWFFQHARQRTLTATPQIDLIPLPDYIFRYNRGSFWCGSTVFDLLGLPYTAWTRRLLDRLLQTRTLYKALHAQKPSTLMVIQDVALPMAGVESFVEWQSERMGIWPLWFCPLKTSEEPTLHPHELEPDVATSRLMLNVGVYGVSPRNYEEWITANRELEEKVTVLGGMKWAYAVQFYPQDAFWKLYDRTWYDSLRKKYHAEGLPTIYDKTVVDVEDGRKVVAAAMSARRRSRWPGLWNVRGSGRCMWVAWKSKAWRLERGRAWREWPPRDEVRMSMDEKV